MGWVCIPKTHETTVWTLTAIGMTATHKMAIAFPRLRWSLSVPVHPKERGL
jgi:hypothetical protein